MILSDWTQCPSCKMCGIYSELKKVLENENTCPMCDQQVHPMSVKISDDSSADFKALVALMKDPPSNEEEEGNNEEDSDNEDANMLA